MFLFEIAGDMKHETHEYLYKKEDWNQVARIYWESFVLFTVLYGFYLEVPEISK